MLKAFRCDLHIHSCLSPCAELDMYPRALVNKCLADKLDVIGLCDHNASENVQYVKRLAGKTPLKVIPGMEITSSEEVHLLALFDLLDPLLQLQETIYAHLPGINNEKIFGCQAIVNDRDEVEGFNDRLLIGATTLPLNDILDRIHALGGLAIASHIDRESFSVISQLGFIEENTPFDALEVSDLLGIRMARRQYPELSSFAIIESSDAHFIGEIGRTSTLIVMESPRISELKMAFAGIGGRHIQE